MSSKIQYKSTSKKICNDFKGLDAFQGRLINYAAELKKNTETMKNSIIQLNQRGFTDQKFSNLYQVFTENVENITKIEHAMNKYAAHIQGLSEIIKKYYKVEI